MGHLPIYENIGDNFYDKSVKNGLLILLTLLEAKFFRKGVYVLILNKFLQIIGRIIILLVFPSN